MKAVVAAFNQEKALVGAFSVLTNLRMELFQALVITMFSVGDTTSQGDTRLHSLGHTLSVSSSSCRSLPPGRESICVPSLVAICDTATALHAGISPYLYRYGGGRGA